MAPWKLVTTFLLINIKGELSGLLWNHEVCAPDTEDNVPEGQDQIGRFPWLGIIQYTYMVGGRTYFAVTTGVLVHPRFVLAPAVDISKIPPELLRNNTMFVAWDCNNAKYALHVKDYSLHPEFSAGTNLASVALLELYPTGLTGSVDIENPLLPICLNLQGAVPFTELYAVQMTDEEGEPQKYVYKMDFVSETDCDEFYNKAGLGWSKMRPSQCVCAVSELERQSCVWDAGTVLITRQSWGYWKLLGFGVRGAGCGAPARFIFTPGYMQWIDDVISMGVDVDKHGDETHKIFFRRLSPVKMVMYKGDTRLPTYQGQCHRDYRGDIIYKDASEILVNKNFVQGFYFVSVAQIVEIRCAIVTVQSSQRTNAAVWVEHHCHRELSGQEPNMRSGPDYNRLECFMFFKSTAYLEIRFYFAFKALIEITMYGKEEQRWVGNPYDTTWTTDKWEPTNKYLRWGSFYPYYISYSYL